MNRFQATSIRLLLLAGASLCAQTVLAQQAPPATDTTLEKIEITGSLIKRIEAESAVPVQVLTKADIEKSGATSVTDLIQNLPAMQGWLAPSNSVNGAGGGQTTAALHALPSKYTVVLLDGKRVAGFSLNTGGNIGGGSAVNIESLPLDSIERIEILTDGASTLYGSDAIAGVLNFITKKNTQEGNVFFNFSNPEHPGGKGWNAGVNKGFGNLDTDGWNIMASYSHDFQDKIDASQRDFTKRGANFPFSSGGTNYILYNATSNTAPGNITFRATNAAGVTSSYALNPYYTANGNCGNSNAQAILDPTGTGALKAIGVSCRFNYAATVEDVPMTTRDSGLIKGSVKLDDKTTLWGEMALSEVDVNSRFAAPAQPLVTNPTTRLPTLYNTYVAPFLAANGLTQSTPTANIGYRAIANGGRQDDWITDLRHISFGVDGTAMGWDYKASLTLSDSSVKDVADGGYTDYTGFAAQIAAGNYDPILETGAASIAPYILHTTYSKTQSILNTLQVEAQHDTFKLPGGTSVLGIGAEFTKTHYVVDYDNLLLTQSGFSTQPNTTDYPVGGSYGQVPLDAARTNYALFAEWLLPAAKGLEATLSARYDNYSKIHSQDQFSAAVDAVTGLQDKIADADVGNSFSDTTGKISVRWTPIEQLLVRGSYGTGFKAPAITDVAGALTFGGSTSGTYACPFPGSAGCIPGSAQYDLLAGPNGLSGNAGLKAEKSQQWTFGLRVDPIKELSLGADLWNVKVTNQIISGGIAEQVGFNNPQQYAGLFVNPYQDPAGFTTIAFQQLPFNGGEADYRGIDWDFSFRAKSSIGNWSASWTGTHMLKQQYNDGPGQPFSSDLGVYGPDQTVVFKTTMNLSISLQYGSFLHTLSGHYKSGYHDQSYTAGNAVIFLANPDGTRGAAASFGGLDVPAQSTFDWQTRYSVNKTINITAGIRNLFDKAPPLSLQTGGGGNSIGYDNRYYDAFLRTFYAGASYKF